MADDSFYTPPTDQVRSLYVEYRDSRAFVAPSAEQERRHISGGGAGGEFDRWLAGHDAQVANYPGGKLAEAVFRGLADRGFDFSDDDVAHIVGLIIAARSDD